MQTAPNLRLVKGHPSPMTANSLIREAERNRTGEPDSIEKQILFLPEGLTAVLDAVLMDFDYRDNLISNTAIACRMLAAMIMGLEFQLKELCHE
jgi:hypothetical protein